MPIQSVLFNRDVWNIFSAHQWLIKHFLYPIKSPDITENFIRFRINNPSKYKRFITKKLPKDIEIIIGYY
jgi:hypothetical protein